MDSLEHIDLTEDEHTEALIWAKQRKEAILEQQRLREIEEINRRQLTGFQWDCDQTKGYMNFRAGLIFDGKFQKDKHSEPLFDLLCLYFSNDRGFVSAAKTLGVATPSLEKGILLGGNFGVGKTWMMKLFSKNQRQVFHIHNAKSIADQYSGEGVESIERYLEKTKLPVNDKDAFFQPYAGLCIDDMGTEEVKTHFGNKKNVIGDLIELRYSKQNTGVWLHATTNLSAKEMTDFYGGRVVSRMKEIFNFIEFKGEDRRK